MNGMNSHTGKALTGVAHLAQSIWDIITTPIGSRVLRRDYGCYAFELLDAPMNDTTTLQLISSIADALDKWEPRLRATRVQIVSAQTDPGQPSIREQHYDLVAPGGEYLVTENGDEIGIKIRSAAPGQALASGFTVLIEGILNETGQTLSLTNGAA